MRPNPNYFHLRSSTSMTLNERFSRLDQKKPPSFTPSIRRGGIQKPRATNIRNLRGKLNQLGSTRLNQSNPIASSSPRGGLQQRRASFRGMSMSRGGRSWPSSAVSGGSGQSTYRGSFRGRGGLNMRRGGRRLGPMGNSAAGGVKKTPEEKKVELDAELDAYMHDGTN